MAAITGSKANEPGIVEILLSSTDGFRYFEFEPPIEFGRLVDCPLPVMMLAQGKNHVWYPTSIETDRKTGYVARVGFFSEAFHGGGQRERGYAQVVARHIGNAIVKP